MARVRQICTDAVQHLRARTLTELALIAGAFAAVIFVGLQTIGN